MSTTNLPYVEGDTLTYQCLYDYIPGPGSDDGVVTCQSDGSWSTSTLVCLISKYIVGVLRVSLDFCCVRYQNTRTRFAYELASYFEIFILVLNDVYIEILLEHV